MKIEKRKHSEQHVEVGLDFVIKTNKMASKELINLRGLIHAPIFKLSTLFYRKRAYGIMSVGAPPLHPPF
jgi:hypothetical protein